MRHAACDMGRMGHVLPPPPGPASSVSPHPALDCTSPSCERRRNCLALPLPYTPCSGLQQEAERAALQERAKATEQENQHLR